MRLYPLALPVKFTVLQGNCSAGFVVCLVISSGASRHEKSCAPSNKISPRCSLATLGKVSHIRSVRSLTFVRDKARRNDSLSSYITRQLYFNVS